MRLGKVWCWRLSYEIWIERCGQLLAYYKVHEMPKAPWRTWYDWKWDMPRAVHEVMYRCGLEDEMPATYYDPRSPIPEEMYDLQGTAKTEQDTSRQLRATL